MQKSEQQAICNQCNNSLNEASNLSLEERRPCPTCGSLNRRLQFSVSDIVTMHDSLRLVHKDSKGKKLAQVQSGADLHRDSNTWRILERVIDWDKKWYTETIKDSSGKVLKHTSESLEKHIDHGSAKYKKH